MKTTHELRKVYPYMNCPIECEKGCGRVIEVIESLRSYERDELKNPKLICANCAEEYGHLDEEDD